MLSDTQIQRLLDVGNAACQKGLVREGRAIFEGVLAVRPDFAPALIGQAFSHLVVDHFDEAKAILLDTVLASNPADPDALALLGMIHMLEGHSDEARNALTKVPEGVPSAAVAKALLAEMA